MDTNKTAGGAVFILGLVFSGCAHGQRLDQQSVQCGDRSIQGRLPPLTGQAAQILTSMNPNFQNALDALSAAGGDAAGCAVQQATNNLQHTKARGAVAETAIVRGQTWLRNQPKAYRLP